MKRRTKLIATIGPASSSLTMLRRMMRSGMDVARLNFSHGTHEDHKDLFDRIRAAARCEKKYIGILQDLQGPKIRIGSLPEQGIFVEKGQTVQFYAGRDSYQKDGLIPVTYDHLHKDVKKGHRLFINDGFVETVVLSVKGKIVNAKVVYGGLVESHKGINLPDSKVSAPALSKKDHEDVLFGLELGVDFVALSFVTTPNDVASLRRIIGAKCRSLKRPPAKIFAKIERREAVECFEAIAQEADGIMIARGDLGVELEPEQVPILQKEMTEYCRRYGKSVVVATHMMESMTKNPRATRAETSDVANAVIDHTDAVMLSAETATGQYPSTAVKTMAAIIDEAEASRFDDISFSQLHDLGALSESIAQSLYIMAANHQIDAIATATSYSPVAAAINIFRPDVPIFLACPTEHIARQMLLRAGIHPVVLPDAHGTFILRMERKLRREKLVKKNGKVAYVTAVPSGEMQCIVR